MTKNEFEILHYFLKHGKCSYRDIANETNISLGTISSIVKSFVEHKLVDDEGITQKGLKALEPYKVNNAIILAAGPSSRFVPLSLEQPKGLFKVKGEVLIERQIRQLQEAGIKDITLVLGYKKETFFYLIDKYNVNIIINTEFNKKNNIESIFLARKILNNSYICSCDDYFVNNPFNQYEYQTFYASIKTSEKTKEMYALVSKKNEIIKLEKGLSSGQILLGHSFWNKEFSDAFISLVKQFYDSGDYDGAFWEKLVADHIDELPSMFIKEYPDNVIFEFDTVEELRAFDYKYVGNTESIILDNICDYFNCREEDVTGFRPIFEGLTNTSFIFSIDGKRYVYRQPGEGTDSIVNRKHEKLALKFARENGFDTTFLILNDKEGWKISTFVDNFREPDYESLEDSEVVATTLRKLHSLSPKNIDWSFQPVEEALEIEKQIRAKTRITMPDFDKLKERILKIYENTKCDGVEPCMCHGDTYRHNWMFTDKEPILIDWEYAGLGDPGIDVGYYIVDAMYSFEDAERFIKQYLEESYSEQLRYHYFAYSAIIAYYWFVWALYREACGAVMGDSLYNWYLMAKRYSEYLEKDSDIGKALTRPEFELLKYIVDEKGIVFDTRILANTLLMSVETLTKAFEQSLLKGYVSLNRKKYVITEKGLLALKPYEVNRAIIVAAGFGSRMVPVTLKTPKPLVKVNGKRIIDTLLDALLSKGIDDIYLVRGYKKECFDELLEKYPNIHLVDNDDYNVTNNISSLMKVIEKLDNCYICEADFVVSNPNIISKYHYCSNYLGTRVIETDDWCYRNVDGIAKDYKKGGTNVWQSFGISYWDKTDSKKIRYYLPKIFETKEGKQVFYEMCMFDFYKDEFQIEIRNCSKFDIVEIDGFQELCEVDPSYKNFTIEE